MNNTKNIAMDWERMGEWRNIRTQDCIVSLKLRNMMRLKLDSTVSCEMKLRYVFTLTLKHCREAGRRPGRVHRCSVLASLPVWEKLTCRDSICCEASRCLSHMGVSGWHFEWL